MITSEREGNDCEQQSVVFHRIRLAGNSNVVNVRPTNYSKGQFLFQVAVLLFGNAEKFERLVSVRD